MPSPSPSPVRISSGLDPRVMIFRVQDEVDVFAVRTERFVVLVDTTGTPSQCRQVLDLLAQELSQQQLIVVNTHADWDHVWGNSAVSDRATIVAHEAAVSRLRSVEALETLRGKRDGSARFAEVELVEPTVTFRDSLVLNGGDLTLRLLHTPGHTDDHISIWVPELRLCLAGDAAEDPIPEVTDPTPANLELLRGSLRRLSDLRPACVLPSHGETSSPELLDRNLGYFTSVTERVDAFPAIDLQADLPAELGFDEFATGVRRLTPAMREFYQMSHRKAVHAASLSRRT